MWLVDLPGNTETAVVGLAIAVVALLVKYAVAYFPWLYFLKQFEQEWGVALGALVVGLLENYLPGGAWLEVSNLAVLLVVAVVTTLLGKIALAKAEVEGFI